MWSLYRWPRYPSWSKPCELSTARLHVRCHCRADGVSAVYSGHDHDNDFVALWRGVRFAYGCASYIPILSKLACFLAQQSLPAQMSVGQVLPLLHAVHSQLCSTGGCCLWPH
jgi:hypothetical protein